MRALKASGHQVTLASRLRSFEGDGDPQAQSRIRSRARSIRRRMLVKYQALPAIERPMIIAEAVEAALSRMSVDTSDEVGGETSGPSVGVPSRRRS